ncbi:MAG: hypothetical protein AAF558_12700, partial [Verrucomicrobiota bacterium]
TIETPAPAAQPSKPEPVKTPKATPPKPAPVAVPARPAAPQVSPGVPAAVPVAPTAVPVAPVVQRTNELRLLADPNTDEASRYARVIAIRNGEEVILYEDILPAGQEVPSIAFSPWTGEKFIVLLREAAAVNIIFNQTNFGKYERSGVQRVELPATN